MLHSYNREWGLYFFSADAITPEFSWNSFISNVFFTWLDYVEWNSILLFLHFQSPGW